VDGCVYLGSGELVTVREVAETIRDLVGSKVQPTFGALPDRPNERIRAADLEATRQALAWSPTTPLPRGLKKTVDFYRGRSG
jgi:UDP-glucose 4-epimerase